MESDSPTLWIGRVTAPGSTREHVVRIRTEGRAPGPMDRFEAIEDPFEAADARRGAAPGADAVTAAHALPILGSLTGRLGEWTLRPPVRPGKIICVGRNYRAHAEEMENPVPDTPLTFFKPASALIASGQPIELPPSDHRIDYEGELVVAIGRVARRITAKDAWAHVAGYTLGNDVSDRVLQRQDKHWTRAKGTDSFAPLGPFLRLRGPNPSHGSNHPNSIHPGVRIRTYVDDELRQDGAVRAMIFDIPAVIEHLAAWLTLEPGDLIYTGTPSGVGRLVPGNMVRVEADGLDLGRLTNPVVAAQD